MNTQIFEDEREWQNARIGKITGTKVKGLLSKSAITKDKIITELNALKLPYKKSASKGLLEAMLPEESLMRIKMQAPKKMGYYDLIAEKLIEDDGIDLGPMDRGTYLETDALELFRKETGKNVDDRKILWSREDDPNIACSPDGVIGKTEAVEVKCLSAGRHVEAMLTGKIPSEYMEQAIQYFVVNDKLKKLYFVFFDPRLIVKQFFFHIIERAYVQKEVIEYLEIQKEVLKEIDLVVAELTDF